MRLRDVGVHTADDLMINRVKGEQLCHHCGCHSS